MKDFAALYAELDATTRTGAKVAALAAYLRLAPPADAAWAVALLIGRRPKRAVPVGRLREWISTASGHPPWLIEECHEQVGDLAKTAALLMAGSGEEGSSGGKAEPLSHMIEERVIALAGLAPEAQRALVVPTWQELSPTACLVYTKLITGGFRVGVAAGLVQRAVAEATGTPLDVVANRLAGAGQPTAAAWLALGAEAMGDEGGGRPFPFALAHAWDGHDLGPIALWQVEWKWDGIRAQLIHAPDGSFRLWSRGDEDISAMFPDVLTTARLLPRGTILDGEVLAWSDERPEPFGRLQQRLGRKKPGPTAIARTPCRFLAYDALAVAGEDLRSRVTPERRAALETLAVACSPVLQPVDWPAASALRAAAREHQVEGLMLKLRAAPYPRGRVTGAWWKWKADPFTLDAVLLYAQAGHGRRAGLHTDYTLGIWRGDELVPVAKAYSGLTDAELKEMDRWIRAHTTATFGPVRQVEPHHVFELAFDGVQLSPRHKSGLALRFPRIARWRLDKPAREADTVETVRRLL